MEGGRSQGKIPLECASNEKGSLCKNGDRGRQRGEYLDNHRDQFAGAINYVLRGLKQQETLNGKKRGRLLFLWDRPYLRECYKGER